MAVYFLTAFVIFLLAYFSQVGDVYSEKLTEQGHVFHSAYTRRIVILACIVLVCVAGWRYYVGSDYGGYYHYYWKYANELWDRVKSLDEPGYSALSAVAKAVGADGSMAIFLASLITVSLCIFTIYKNTSEIQYALLLYMFMGWSAGFNAVRQAMAATFLFAGFPFLRDKKFVRFLLFVFLAFLCHKSAIIMIVLYFLAHRKVNFFNFVIMIIGIVVLLGSYNFIFQVAENVLDKDYDMSNTYLNTSVNILRILVGISPAVYFGFSLLHKDKSGILGFYLNLLFIHALINIITLNSAYIARIAIYTSPFALISISELSKTIEIKYRRVIMIVIIILYFIFWIYEMNNNNSLRTFRFIWQA